MNLDVISIAMEEQYEEKARKQRQKVLPEDDDTDPNIYVEETVTILLPTANSEAEEITDETQANDYLEWRRESGVELEVQYLNSIRNGKVEDDTFHGDRVHDENEEVDSDESYVSEESANKMAMAMML